MPINVAFIGAGNCAKSLVEGIALYTHNREDTIGLMHPRIGGYHPSAMLQPSLHPSEF